MKNFQVNQNQFNSNKIVQSTVEFAESANEKYTYVIFARINGELQQRRNARSRTA